MVLNIIEIILKGIILFLGKTLIVFLLWNYAIAPALGLMYISPITIMHIILCIMLFSTQISIEEIPYNDDGYYE